MRAAIFVGPDDALDAIDACKAICAQNSWAVQHDRVVILDEDHPEQGLPVALFPSSSSPVEVLVVPTWDALIRGLFGTNFQVNPEVKGRNARVIATGLKTAEEFFSTIAANHVRLFVVAEGRAFDADEILVQVRGAYAPLMESAAEWDADLSREIRAGQDRAWASGKRVGRPPRQARDIE